ncbi:type VI secretion system-associated FHA domain protein TagH [Serratia proteamaculans]|uniref:Type VI secretion system-associated FHA domain protein TagH n=1 Tax=Serratia proteamaculans TaxID=28151 RepID=A0A7U0RMJ3_SERPR|nr:type VI secretion system-associated FHA domain protein TagH [Serratia proteamaculans]MBO1503522.1 type VI secretion system-associated FHA domain protein TagH [Serratia proteamaculans]MDW5510784.1 type VI secretion system-associated FHA domain protein TagH [Serratia proteamaculans]QQX52427.1 type VI secretion system-associated FHA domain protein TagH [Serratia proteamaculans]
MRFSIVKNKSGQVAPQSSCDFLPPGGTIGRSVDNNLVLPDEERAISRLQAIVHISADGECRVTNRGNVTRVLLNDIPLERGRQVELQDGDILGIDDYQIQVTSLQQAAAPQAQPAVKTADTAPVTTPAAKEKSAAPIPNEIWDSLVEEFTPAAAVNPRPAPVINQDSHPLLETPEPEMNPADPLAQLAGGVELRQLQSQQTDPAMLFNTDTTFERDPILADTTPSALLAEQRPTTSQAAPIKPAELKKNEQELDPLALFGGSSTPASPEALNSNDPLGLLMGSAVPLTQPEVPQPPLQQPAMVAREETPQPKATPQPVAQPTPLPQPEPQYSPPVQPTTAQPRPRPANRLGIDPIAYQSARTQNGAVASGERLEGPLLAALLQGVGLDDLQPQPHFDEQQLRQAGRLLSLFSQGTVALLSSRSILKRGVKAEMTMILDEANNPFKLLPSGKTVLMQMFGSKMPGFMPPEQAVRDALIDLQAHQLGMIAGIRAIIAAMLQSFNPDRLEEEARKEGAAPRLSLPASRKAALWDYFVKSYQQTSGEIEDDFHTLFGEAFLHAYDVEVNQYKDSQTQPDA